MHGEGFDMRSILFEFEYPLSKHTNVKYENLS